MRRAVDFLRVRLEGMAAAILIVALFPRWLRLPAGDCGRIARRWGSLLRHGFGFFRASWRVLLSLESSRAMSRHAILLEWLDTLKTGGGPARTWEAFPERGRVLFVQLGHLGDLMHMVPMLRSLRRQRPHAVVDLLVGPWAESLARRLPHVNRVLVYSTPFRLFNRGGLPVPSLRAEYRFLRELREARYDALFSMATTNPPELLLWCAARPSFGLGAPVDAMQWYRLGEVRAEPYDTTRYEPVRACGLLKHIGLEPGDPTLDPLIDEADATSAEAVLERHGIRTEDTLAVLAPGAGWPGKCWPADRFAALASWLETTCGLRVILVGSRDERDLLQRIAQDSGRPLPCLAGELSWSQLGAVIRRSQLFVGNDSGPLHLAAACGTPAVAFFGPTPSRHWMPDHPRQVALQADYDCVGCIPWHVSATCRHDNACMRSISVSDAQQAVTRIQPRTRRENSTCHP